MKSTNNIITEGLSGKIQQIVFRQHAGKTIVSKRPKITTIPPTASQLNIRLTFRDAVIYGRSILADPVLNLAYKAKARPGQTAFNVAVADFFKPPVVGDISTDNYTSLAGSYVTVPVTDNFRVKSVTVSIKKPDETLVEEGAAVLQPDGIHWQYDVTVLGGSTAGNIVTVKAGDTPGHFTVKQITV